jgi:putative MFS transporter
MSSNIKVRAADSDDTSAAFKRRFMRRLIAVLIGGMFLDGYILGIIGPVTGVMKDDLGISDLWMGLIAAGPLFGIFFGSPLGGWATDKFGRKPLFLIDMGLFVIASGLQFFAGAAQFFVGSALQLFIVRFLMGVAIGGEYSIGWPLMSEFAPARLRGRLLGVTLIAWYAGFMIAYLVGHVLVTATDLSWRFVLGTSTFSRRDLVHRPARPT